MNKVYVVKGFYDGGREIIWGYVETLAEARSLFEKYAASHEAKVEFASFGGEVGEEPTCLSASCWGGREFSAVMTAELVEHVVSLD